MLRFEDPIYLWLLFIIPVLVVGILILYMYHRIQGYTGDCCGATFLFCEASIYLCFLLVE